jgi:chitinase
VSTTYSVHPGGSIEPGPKPADCTPAEAALCLTTSVFATTVSGGSTKTTGTSVTETCATITGCNLRDVDATTTANACTIQRRAVRETDVPEPEEKATSKSEQVSAKAAEVESRAIPPTFIWACEQLGTDGMIWPFHPDDSNEQEDIRQMLTNRQAASNRKFDEVRADDLGITAFWIVRDMGDNAMDFFNSQQVPQIFLAYHPDNPVLPPHVPKEVKIISRDVNGETGMTGHIEQRSVNNETAQPLSKRVVESSHTNAWHLSMVSWPTKYPWDKEYGSGHLPANGPYFYTFDDSYGLGQTIYIFETDLDITSPVSSFPSCFLCLVYPLVSLYKASNSPSSMFVHLSTAY